MTLEEIRISELPEAAPIQGDELLEMVQDGENVKVRANQLGGGGGSSSGIERLDFDQEALLQAGREFPLFSDFPDPTKNYKGLIINEDQFYEFPYTATYDPLEGRVIEIFPHWKYPYAFSYGTYAGETGDLMYPISATPYYSVKTSSSLPTGVASLKITYQLENSAYLSIAGIEVDIDSGNAGVTRTINLNDLYELTVKIYGMPMNFYHRPFFPEQFSDDTENMGVVGITEDGIKYQATLRNGFLKITSEEDYSHTLDIKVPVFKKTVKESSNIV